MTEAVGLSASLEDYLEAIYNIIQEKSAVRAKDIAAKLQVSNASVTGALKTLAKRHFLNYAPYDVITLTPKGEKLAREIVRRHQVLKDFFVKVLAIDEDEANKTACKLEHGISPEIINRLVQFIEFIDVCPLGGDKLIEGFKRHLECGVDRNNCLHCLDMAKGLVSQSGQVQKIQKKTLGELKAGERGLVRGIKTKGPLKKRLSEMGLTPGSVVDVERVAPMGDPIDVKVRGYHLSLRKEDAEKIAVEVR